MYFAQRKCGILLHPTSLPGRFGIGDLGSSAYQFLDFLKLAKQTFWQILPLGPPSYGNSPYQCVSSFAGNPLLISPDLLHSEGYISESCLESCPQFSDDTVAYSAVNDWKEALFQEAFQEFQKRKIGEDWEKFEQFCFDEKHWLEDFACFAALKAHHQKKSWHEWPQALAFREPGLLNTWKTQHLETIQYHQFVQYQFQKQWQNLRNYAQAHGIQIIGDLPIFVAYDSAEVWSFPDLFILDEQRLPRVVAGVPPDYFSATGQLWGNPLYDWSKMAKDDYLWWQNRLKMLLKQVDVIRIDHFRGFEKYWEVPASEETAIKGRWIDGPRADFFQVLEKNLGTLPFIAEDLGLITPEVEQLREQFGFPGMKVLQFAFFEGEANPYLPHHYDKNTIVYTGTHDNNTTQGWFQEISEADRQRVIKYLGIERTPDNISEAMVRLAWASTANTAIAPLQDLMNLDSSARMNLPGTVGKNWMWRFQQERLTEELAGRLRELTEIYQRC